jgi:hypothetical protein
MKRLALAILLAAVVAASMFLALRWPRAEASPDPTITVNSTADTNARNPVMTLREALMLATGDLTLADLTHGECDQVSTADWEPGPSQCESTDPPGAASADTIVFDSGVFPPASPRTITLSDNLPPLDTGNDTVDGSAAGVIVDGGSGSCFDLESSNNTIKGLVIHSCLFGVRVGVGFANNTIGGGNVIYGNTDGIQIAGYHTARNVVVGNYIGTDATGNTAMPNDVGVHIAFGSENTVGGITEAERNVISGNWFGVQIHAGDGNVVVGNYIGVGADGETHVPNGVGVKITADSANNTVGGVAQGEGNLIAFNASHGVLVDGNIAINNAIRRNSIHSNGGKGIENVDGGNLELAPPVITGFDPLRGTACPNCTIDIFSDDEDEGREYWGSYAADGAGNWSTLPGRPQGPNVTATATDDAGNTSEFSAPVEVPEATPTPSATPTPPAGPTRTLEWAPGWHNETWSGPNATDPEDAFSYAAGKYAAAYRYVNGGLERFFPDRPEISDMTPLAQYDTFLILITQPVTCVMPVAPGSPPTRTLEWGAGWQNDGWTGAGGTAPGDAFACADGSYAAAYRFTDAGLERFFPGQSDISDMDPLAQYDAFLILVTAPVSCTMAIAP